MFKEKNVSGKELQSLLALLRAPGLGPRTLGKLLQTVSTSSAVFELPAQILYEIGLKSKTLRYIQDPNWSLVENDLRWFEKERNYLIPFASPFYLNLLKQIYDPPLALYLQGDPEVLSTIQLGVVGSRNPNQMADDWLEILRKSCPRSA